VAGSEAKQMASPAIATAQNVSVRIFSFSGRQDFSEMSALQEITLSENQQATTLDEDLKKIRDAKYDRGLEADVCNWIGFIIGYYKPANDSAASWLKSGDVLCTLMNCIRPATIKKYNVNTTSKFKQMENITLFLRACREVGMLEKDLFSTIDLFEAKDMNAVILSLFNLGGTIQSTIPYFTGPKLGIKQTNRNFPVVPQLEQPAPPKRVAPPVVAPITDPVPVVLEHSPVYLDPLPAVNLPVEQPVISMPASTTAALPASPAAAISMATLVKPPAAPAAFVSSDLPPVPKLPEIVARVLSPPMKPASSAVQATVASIPSMKTLNPKLLNEQPSSPPRSPPANRETIASSLLRPAVSPPAAPQPPQPSNVEMDIKPRKRTALTSKQIINSTKTAVAQSVIAVPAPVVQSLIQPPQIPMPAMQMHPAAMGTYQSYGSHLLRQVTAQQQRMMTPQPYGYVQQPQAIVRPQPQRKHIMPRDESEEAIALAVVEWIEAVSGEGRHPTVSLFHWLASGEVLCRLANIVLGASPNPHIRITGVAQNNSKDNTKKFIDICRLVGVAESELFSPTDLCEGRNVGKVMRCVASLGGILQNYEWWVNSPFAQLGKRVRIQSVVKV
jgi:hypothetical protein